MTVREVVGAMLRRWYVVVAAIALAAVAFFALAGDGGAYSTRTVVSFMYPASTSLTPDNGITDENLIAFAGAIAHEINNGKPATRYSTDDAPFYGAGVREGVLVGLPNAGSQWSTAFTKAEIEIQIVGRTEDWVRSKQQELVDKVLATAESEQDALGASSEDRITASVVPLTLQIEQITASRTSVLAAAMAMGLAALIAGIWAAVGLDHGLDRLSRRRVEPAPSLPVLKGLTP